MSLLNNKLIVPERCREFVWHTWSKKDTLEKVAKSYGLKDWKVIWKYDTNKALVGKRKKKESLEAGDKLAIPPNPARKKKVLEAVHRYNDTKRATVKMVQVLEGQKKDLEKEIEEFYKVVDAANRRKFDAQPGEKELLDLLITSTGTLVQGLENLAGATKGLNLKLDKVTKIAAAVKSYRARMKGGTIDEAALKTMRTLIDAARKEIRGLDAQISQLEVRLEKAAAKTIGVFCREKSLKSWVVQMLKEGLTNSPF